ncbi:unnamed protein product [Heterosigma akashiwo]|uniref:Uncharacterized protein n=1 Tax=Heterosigma akashiwo TaxID=2829 RepID=A0A6V2Q2H4_HETAK|mmetsp:Transcript_24478/g.33893  ORF Transcript_24478/g.33893 Transcript_24478/m.33893 type:complete len:129 (+) Transcript_24478:47-433(+)
MKPSSLWKFFILGIAGLWIGVAEQSGFIEDLDLEVFTCAAYLCENNPQAVSSYLSSGCKDAALLSDENTNTIVMEADSQLSFLENSKTKSLSQKNIVFLGSSFLLLGAFLGFTVGYQQEKKKGSSLLL